MTLLKTHKKTHHVIEHPLIAPLCISVDGLHNFATYIVKKFPELIQDTVDPNRPNPNAGKPHPNAGEEYIKWISGNPDLDVAIKRAMTRGIDLKGSGTTDLDTLMEEMSSFFEYIKGLGFIGELKK